MQQPFIEDGARDGSTTTTLLSRYTVVGGDKTPTSSRPNTSSGPSTGFSSNDLPFDLLSISSQGSSGFAGIIRKSSLTFGSRPPKTPNSSKSRTPSVDHTSFFGSPEKPEPPKTKSKPPVSLRSPDRIRRNSLGLTKRRTNTGSQPPSSHDNQYPDLEAAGFGRGNYFYHHSGRNSISSRDSISSTGPYEKMLANYGANHNRAPLPHGTLNGPAAMAAGAIGPMSPTMETITFQHIQEMAAKRISTLDYLRKAHEGRVYWFNTLLFTKADLSKMTYFDVRKLSRRATNYLLLGLSLPAVSDLYSSTPLEFLRTLNALLAEFETFQSIHPPDGSTSSLSRARLPQMFKRSMGTTGSKPRRTSSAADIGLPYGSSLDHDNSPISAFPSSDSELLPGEEYTYLMTPSLPFDPDFYETFATLCDVLIDCYTKLMQLVASPKECGPAVAEAFTNADKRVRKIIVSGVVKEFEEASRVGVKAEVAGVGKVVLGGLM